MNWSYLDEEFLTEALAVGMKEFVLSKIIQHPPNMLGDNTCLDISVDELSQWTFVESHAFDMDGDVVEVRAAHGPRGRAEVHSFDNRGWVAAMEYGNWFTLLIQCQGHVQFYRNECYSFGSAGDDYPSNIIEVIGRLQEARDVVYFIQYLFEKSIMWETK